MLFTRSTLLLLSSSLLSAAWEIHSISEAQPVDHRNIGYGTSDCINRNHKRDGKLRFSREGSNCCLHIYKEVDCNLGQYDENKRSICRDYNRDIDFHFRSYYVDCEGRGINNPTPPSQAGNNYGNGQPSYGNNQPPSGYTPQPWGNNNPPPYNGNPPQYSNPPPPQYGNNQPQYGNNQPQYGNNPPPYSNNPQPYNPQGPYSPCRPGDRCYVKAENATAKADTQK